MGKNDNFAMDDLANDLDRLLNELNIEKCTLICHSIGGKIAAVYAKHNSHKIDAIIFISGSSIPIPEDKIEDSISIKLATTKGMEAVAEYERQQKHGKERRLRMRRNGICLKKYLQKPLLKALLLQEMHYVQCLMI